MIIFYFVHVPSSFRKTVSSLRSVFLSFVPSAFSFLHPSSLSSFFSFFLPFFFGSSFFLPSFLPSVLSSFLPFFFSFFLSSCIGSFLFIIFLMMRFNFFWCILFFLDAFYFFWMHFIVFWCFRPFAGSALTPCHFSWWDMTEHALIKSNMYVVKGRCLVKSRLVTCFLKKKWIPKPQTFRNITCH